MPGTRPKDISGFFIAGINYRKTDASIRGQFAISTEQYALLLEQSPSFGVHEFFIVSTCNRTEIYGFAENAAQLIHLLCSQTQGSKQSFTTLCYTHQGIAAVEHFFKVGAGLDSQILGDYEIVGQIKQAAKFAKKFERIDVFTERLVNCMLQSSKAIKNQTSLSEGTVSVSFAAVQYLRENVPSIQNKKILLLGTGKIGRATCKNMVDYLGTKNITLINRTEEKAAALATELNLEVAAIDQLDAQIAIADIILVATSASEPSVLKTQLNDGKPRIVIDLSIPNNVEPSVQSLPSITLLNVDELSKMKDATLAKREAEVPRALAILSEASNDFIEWYRNQCYTTTRLVTETLGIPTNKYSISFQSRLGKDPWLKPYTDFRLAEMPNEGIKKLLILCPAFVSDCLETLEEIEERGKETFLQAGGEKYTMIPCLNVHPQWVKTLAGWARDYTAGSKKNAIDIVTTAAGNHHQ